eukprot:1139491-Pelagomonas_calceolata.AAC.2
MQGQPRHGPGCKGREQLRICNAKRGSTQIAACTQDQKYPSRPSTMPNFPSWNTAHAHGKMLASKSSVALFQCKQHDGARSSRQDVPQQPLGAFGPKLVFLNKKAAKEGDKIRPSPQMAPSHQSHLDIHASNKRYCIHRACQTWKCWISKHAPNEQQIVLQEML